jgi:radical SAM superfamily enzyme YgiQ (UPF0313 family)
MTNVLLVAACPGESAWMQKSFIVPSLGLHRLKDWLRSHGHTCKVLNPNITNPYTYLTKYASYFDVAGFSSLHKTLEHDVNLMWHARKCNPNIVIVAGGVEPSLNSEAYFEYGPVDCVVHGEGEKPLLDICENPESYARSSLTVHHTLTKTEYEQANLGIRFKNIPYPTFWRETRRRHPNVPEDESNTVRLITISNCPRRCTFCSEVLFLSRKPKTMAGDSFVQFIENAATAHPNTKLIFFHDADCFFGRLGRERWNMAHERDWKVPFMGQTRIDAVDEDLLSFLPKFKMLTFGVESWSQNIVDEFRKGFKVDQIDPTIRMVLEHGIEVFVNVVLTSPNCTVDDVAVTLERCRYWLRKGVKFGVNLYPEAYPCTELAEKEKVEYETVMIRGRPYEKMRRVLPKNRRVKEAILQTETCINGQVLTSPERSKLIVENMMRVFSRA